MKITVAKAKNTTAPLKSGTYVSHREAEEERADIQVYDSARVTVAAEIKADDFVTLTEHRAKRNGRRK